MVVCQTCGSENPEEARFCGRCGESLVPPCPNCGAPVTPGLAFCTSCGTPLHRATRPAIGEERKVVTVLFVDLVGFTARAERLDPEDVRAFLTPYYERVKAEIERFGGVVEKFIGDAVMGVFGAPVAYGDDPERAVRAALAVREQLLAMNEADPSLDLQARLAVNTGEAIVALGAHARPGEGMVAGDVVNTASRLQTAAPTGEILVGEETYFSTRTVIDYRPTEPVDAKGKALPIPVWLAVAPMGPVGERSFSGVPIIGRGRELGVLRGIWDRMVEETRPHLATVFGPTGVGKSRLAYEFSLRVDVNGGKVFRGRSVAYGESSPYGAFAQVVKQVAGIFDSDELAVSYDKLRAAVAEVTGDADADETSHHLAILLGLRTEGSVSDRETLFFSARLLISYRLLRGADNDRLVLDDAVGLPGSQAFVTHLPWSFQVLRPSSWAWMKECWKSVRPILSGTSPPSPSGGGSRRGPRARPWGLPLRGAGPPGSWWPRCSPPWSSWPAASASAGSSIEPARPLGRAHRWQRPRLPRPRQIKPTRASTRRPSPPGSTRQW